MEKVAYEELFFLKYYGSWSFMEAYNLPIQMRKWWITRLAKQFEKENEQREKASKKSNSPSSSSSMSQMPRK